MFDSYVLNFFYKIYCKINSWYSYSILKKVTDSLMKVIKSVSKSSFIVKTMSNDDNKENVVTYKLYKKLVETIESISRFCREIIKKYSKDSYTLSSINRLSSDKKTVIETTSIFISTLTFVIVIINFLNRGMSIITLVPLIIFIISIITLINCRRIGSDIETSYVLKAIKSIFTVDDEEESIWRL